MIHIDWSRTFAPRNGNFMVNHHCDVIKTGEYELEIFVLNNLENPVSYAPKFVETIII